MALRPTPARVVPAILVVLPVAAGLTLLGRATGRPLALVGQGVSLTVTGLALVSAAIWRARRERRAAWWGGAVFAVAAVATNVVWWAEGATVDGELWRPIYLAGLPVAAATFFTIAFRGLRRGPLLRVSSDLAVIALAGMVGWWVVFVRLTGVEPDTGLAVVVPIFDIVLLAGALTARSYQPERTSLDWLAAAVATAIVTDTLTAAGEPAAGSPLTAAAGVISAWCLTGFFLTVDHAEADFPVTRPRRGVIYLCAGGAVVPLVVLVIANGVLDSTTVLLVAAAVLALVGNQAIVVTELRDVARAKDEALVAMDAAIAALSDSEERFRVAFDGAPVGIVVVEDLVVVEVNRTLPELLGIPTHELVGQSADALVDVELLGGLPGADWEPLTPAIEVMKAELPWTVRGKGDRWLHVTVARVPGSHTGRIIGIVEDVTQERAATARLADLAVQDPLTGLANRSAFVDELADRLDDAGREPLAVGFVDLDRFKVINDSLGHVVGDRLLTVVASRLETAVAGHGMVARFAGDEFTILLTGVDPEGAARVMHSVLGHIEQPIELDEGVITYPTGSIGVAFARAGDTPDTMLARADAAMYRAKERGRNRIELYDGAVEGATAQLRLMGELHRAIDSDELRLHYQPVVDIQTGHIRGFEALLRWQHPTRGLLLPTDFVDLAEESGLIVPIGRWVIQQAIGQLARWDRLRPELGLTMSINLAARQITPELVGHVDSDLSTTGVDPDRIWLEITESALMTDTRLASRVLTRLRRIGVHITVDDFGTGYSSLTYLQRFPVEGIKLDRSFVGEVGRHAQGTAICEALISLGRALDLHVVAEGVETERQREMLAVMGCVLGQGFLFGRPVPAERMVLPAAPGAGRADVPDGNEAPTPAPAR